MTVNTDILWSYNFITESLILRNILYAKWLLITYHDSISPINITFSKTIILRSNYEVINGEVGSILANN